ncbi:MAG: hypothetical protein RI544_04820 [Haloquadratum sp.]|nr:hypothetical protein [Haloquadratum sp.]
MTLEPPEPPAMYSTVMAPSMNAPKMVPICMSEPKSMPWLAPLHLDGIMRSPTVMVDGRPLALP